ncbi:MAG: sulfite exporter TauE/SafE family protein [Pseudomonadales bacterium]|nr:sulfite exporter TauE/SafE family protein [Pseudomonadales bacterium]
MEAGLSDLLLLGVALIGAGGLAGFTAGLFGVGGGFVVVPALLVVLPLLGGDPEKHILVAIGTSLATIIVSSARSVQAHSRRGIVDFELLRGWAPWLVLGVLAGISVASVVNASSLVLVFAIGVLVYSVYFFMPDRFKGSTDNHPAVPSGVGRVALASGLGGFSALLGIGGGTPFIVTMVICGRSLHQAIATAAGVGFIIAIPGALGFLTIGLRDTGLPTGSVGYINVPALIAISAISIFTAPLGATLAHNLSEIKLKRVFGVYLVCVSLAMLHKSL